MIVFSEVVATRQERREAGGTPLNVTWRQLLSEGGGDEARPCPLLFVHDPVQVPTNNCRELCNSSHQPTSAAAPNTQSGRWQQHRDTCLARSCAIRIFLAYFGSKTRLLRMASRPRFSICICLWGIFPKPRAHWCPKGGRLPPYPAAAVIFSTDLSASPIAALIPQGP